MPLSELTDRSHEPTDEELRSVLGKAHEVWVSLIDAVAERIGPVSQTWGYTSKSTGWGLRVRQKDRVILYMTPQTGQLLVSFALGERAVAAAKRLKLPPTLLAAIDAAPRYAEGRGLRLEVSTKRQVSDLAKLAQIKSEN
jgi:hypothetical protein